jgi:hypothetical protein
VTETVQAIAASTAGTVGVILFVVLFVWLLDRRDQAKHDRAMAALDECMIQSLRAAIAIYRVRHSYLNQPVREALPVDDKQRDAEIAKLEEWRRR